ncbi:hypothetical protein M8J76_013557 [Diaphorina citri]|nr:hypothetical protein M8J76_013557 [Diaphorina citri]
MQSLNRKMFFTFSLCTIMSRIDKRRRDSKTAAISSKRSIVADLSGATLLLAFNKEIVISPSEDNVRRYKKAA